MLRPRLLLLLVVVEVVVRTRSAQVEEAVCRLTSGLQGEIRLRASPGHTVEFSGEIAGLSEGKHGFHVHQVRLDCQDHITGLIHALMW